MPQATRHYPFACPEQSRGVAAHISFRMHSYESSGNSLTLRDFKSCIGHSYESRLSNSFRMHSYKKRGEGGTQDQQVLSDPKLCRGTVPHCGTVPLRGTEKQQMLPPTFRTSAFPGAVLRGPSFRCGWLC